ncbi:histidinol-phosphatase (PHP family) [Filibacter limicola]|uniref:Histidinol-phosphatase n=1 Tax=Sporosarcina limicola TaxID=34101 RepID=A0A927R6M4_9BACL|nr:histidinol-phosphatase (PHP family) [Sporosarcina limicola]
MDYHVHLEEGLYSFRWLERTSQALDFFANPGVLKKGSKEHAVWQTKMLQTRLSGGCYGEEWLDLYLAHAKQLGLKEVGIVDHLYRFKETRDYFREYILMDENDPIGKLQLDWLDKVMTEEMVDFVRVITGAKKRWSSEGVELRLGIEADYFVGGEEQLANLLDQYPWDFVIGSVHFIDGWGFDNPQTAYVFESTNKEALYDRFFETVEQAIRSGLFDFIAHLDNLKVFGFRVEDEAFNRMWYERIATALVEMDTATEVNSGLSYRYPVKEMCPGPDFLKILVARGVEFTVSSDAHFPDDLGKYAQQNVGILRDLGVDRLVTFQNRQRIFRPIK